MAKKQKKEGAPEPFDLRAQRVHEVPLDEIICPDAVVSKGFVESIEKDGQKTPVALYDAPESGKFMVADGRRRIAALRILKAEFVKAIKVTKSEADAVTILSNLHRSPNPALEAMVLQRVMREENLGEETLAKRFSLPVARVRQRLALLSLSHEMFMALDEGKATLSAAYKARKLPHEMQEKLLEGNGERVTLEDVHGALKNYQLSLLSDIDIPAPERNGKVFSEAEIREAVSKAQASADQQPDAEKDELVALWKEACRSVLVFLGVT